MIKVLFVMENLGKGGAERVLVNLVNQMDKTRFDITVMTLFEKGVNAESLDPEVRLINKNKPKFKGIKTVSKYIPKRMLYDFYIGKSADKEYDIIIPYMSGVPTTVASGSRLPKISWLHGMFGSDKVINGLDRIYKRYDKVVGVSEKVTERYNELFSQSCRGITLYNTNDTARIRGLAAESPGVDRPEGKTVISTVGCLESSKGYDRLVGVCGRLKDEGKAFELRIIGEGRDRAALEEQIERLGLSDCVKLLGYQTNPYKYVAASDFFVCSSRTEGLSTAVSEAVILGVPVVSTDVSGAREILGDRDEYGLVVESSEEGIYEGMKLFLDDGEKRAYYAAQAAKRAPFFEPENTVSAVEQLIEKTLSGSKR